jgi:hypothetical protein
MTGMGMISFHIHGELARNTPIALNVSVYISPSLYNNTTAEATISNMQAIFSDEVAIIYWLTPTISRIPLRQ